MNRQNQTISQYLEILKKGNLSVSCLGSIFVEPLFNLIFQKVKNGMGHCERIAVGLQERLLIVIIFFTFFKSAANIKSQKIEQKKK